MTNVFHDTAAAQKYLAYLETPDGQFQQNILRETIGARLPKNPAHILDAACGSGWLTHALTQHGHHVVGCDSSEKLLSNARASFPALQFDAVDITKPLPYGNNTFDAVIVSMAAQDVDNLESLYSTLYAALKPSSQLVVTIPNPYYAFPIGIWKRGFCGKLLGHNPRLIFSDKAYTAEDTKPHSTYARSLQEYINQAISNGFMLTRLEELRSAADSPVFGLQYQLFRYPLLLLLDFVKQKS